jgi:hypothetical protein
VIVLPACDASTSEKLWIHIPEPSPARDRIRQIDLGTFAVTEFTPAVPGLYIAFHSAGCVTQLDPNGAAPVVLQTAVLDYSASPLGYAGATPPSTSHVVNSCAGSACSVDVSLPVALAGAGYVTASTESHLVATISDAEGLGLGEYVLLGAGSAAGATDHLIERSRQPTAAEPSIIVSGNFDLGNAADLFWSQADKRGTTFQVAYALQVDNEPLSAESVVAPIRVQQMEVGSFDGGSNAQIAVYGQGTGGAGLRGVSVVPTGVAPAPITILADPMCPP